MDFNNFTVKSQETINKAAHRMTGLSLSLRWIASDILYMVLDEITLRLPDSEI